VRRYDHAPGAEFWPEYLRASAYLQRKEAGFAESQFAAILRHRGEVPATPLYPMAHLGTARAATMARQYDKARKSYETFFELWKQADADLAPLTEARQEYARLP
jgi:outer membrane protein assembly factor BamD (BamD/ComL family)